MKPSRPLSPHRPASVTPASDRLASVDRREEDGVIIATVRGEIDASNAKDIGRELAEVPGTALGLIVDLGQVGHLDSTGIALLFEMHVWLDRRGQSLVVVAPARSAARRVLELTAFATRAVLAEDVDTAVTAARRVARGDLPPDAR